MIFMLGTEITGIIATETLDSRGNPTVMCKTVLSCGAEGRAAVPSGASRGKNEAHEKRDNDARYGGRGVKEVCRRIEEELFDAVKGADASNQKMIDGVLLKTDGTIELSNFGANAILAVSLSCARACAMAYDLPLYRYLGGIYGTSMPVPMMNVLNGGAHASNNIDIQEFMIVPVGAPSYADGVRMCAEIYSKLRSSLKKAGLSTGVGDEGGFAPDFKSDEDAIKYLLCAINDAGYSEENVKLALDVASSEWAENGRYFLPKKNISLSSDELIEKFCSWTEKYPIISLEDPIGEEDFDAWQKITKALPNTMLVGDDLFVTDSHRIDKGAENGIANSVLIKPNQSGTLSGTFAALRSAKKAGYKTIISHRSGDTCDDFIADLAVASCADFIKSGAPARGERVAKYNRLSEIEKEVNFSCFTDV
ncbi:MAG: phosphopyruvate hydratase [Eubacteriales bacterium]